MLIILQKISRWKIRHVDQRFFKSSEVERYFQINIIHVKIFQWRKTLNVFDHEANQVKKSTKYFLYLINLLNIPQIQIILFSVWDIATSGLRK